MQVRFLYAPAGRGKTWLCLDEIRRELLASPEGIPLVFVAPKQATFQLERQLLGEDLAGYSRLQILSFERLARFILESLKQAPPKVLAEQGRVMVLRAILAERNSDLAVFRNCARRPRFAEEVSGQLREFQNHGLSPSGIRKLAGNLPVDSRVRHKLNDLALISELYRAWLDERGIEDGDALLSAAAEVLEREGKIPGGPPLFGGLWLDGFAQMTPQERRLLLAMIPLTGQCTLAFCAPDPDPASQTLHWHGLVQQTAAKLRNEIGSRHGFSIIDIHPVDCPQSRFVNSPDLAHLEHYWNQPAGRQPVSDVRLVRCVDPWDEAAFCARELLRHVRRGGRYREAAVLLRNFDNDYPNVFRRVFQKYNIPFFLDHRESVSHHPLAELTRGVLRTLAFNWRQTDWIATLKSGLLPAKIEEVDLLENEALARGWDGSAWKNGFAINGDAHLEQTCNELRRRMIRPLVELETGLGTQPTGKVLAEALRRLWESVGVEQTLDKWHADAADSVHQTVWTQMNAWLDDLALAFGDQTRSLAEWLTIVEAGLAGLTVGVIPPVLDQVLIGAVDRSRNPDLKLLFVAGFNEGVFPALKPSQGLLTDADRDRLAATGSELGELPAQRFAQEQFYGYIACTRPREKLVVTYSVAGVKGEALNPSRFVGHLQRLFPSLRPEESSSGGTSIEHPCEIRDLALLDSLAQHGAPEALLTWRTRLAALQEPAVETDIAPELATALYGSRLTVSVSSLERYAACPFRFLVEKGLRAQERKVFELDLRERGSFQHEVLARFHAEVTASDLRWRDLTPEQASQWIEKIGRQSAAKFRDGLLQGSPANAFAAEYYLQSLQDFIRPIIDWFKSNRFDPTLAELGFGQQGEDMPAWEVPLSDGRTLVLKGRIDRIDVFRNGDEALIIVIDYKSSKRTVHKNLLYNGVEHQLPGYLLALRGIEDLKQLLNVSKVTPVGCFFVPLKVSREGGKNRSARDETVDDAPQHVGLIDADYLENLDSLSPSGKSGQFNYSLNKDGKPSARPYALLTHEDFETVLNRTHALLLQFAQQIYEGRIAISPFKNGSTTACQHCDYQGICRFDPWTQPFRPLETPVPPTKTPRPKKGEFKKKGARKGPLAQN